MAFFIGLLFFLGVFEGIAHLFGLTALQPAQASATWAATTMFVIIGLMHFFKPEKLEYMIRGFLPQSRFWIYLTGALEVISV